MKVALICLPPAQPLSPALALPSLTAYLRQNDLEVLQVDSAIESLQYLLRTDRLHSNLERFLALAALPRPNPKIERFYSRIKSVLDPDMALPDRRSVEALEQRISALRMKDGVRLRSDSIDKDIKDVNTALVLSSAAYLPTVLALGSVLPFGNWLAAPAQNPFLGYFRDELIPRLRNYSPDLIGISYAYPTQTLSGMTLIAELGRVGITAPIVTGGTAIIDKVDRIRSANGGPRDIEWSVPCTDMDRFELSMMIGTIGIYGEGENALLEVCQRVQNARPLQSIPGAIFNQSGRLHFLPESEPLGGELLPAPDLSGLPLGRHYISPVIMATMMASRGCYWNKCAFCDHATSLGSRYRTLRHETIMNALSDYEANHGVEIVGFNDEGMSPVQLTRISDGIAAAGLKIRFCTMTRFERALVARLPAAKAGGLSGLSFGFESGCARIVKLMNKGYSHEDAQAILDECARLNIWVEMHVMFGFPSESVEEANETVRFIEKNDDSISFIRANPFYLIMDSPVGKDPGRFGIQPAPGCVIAPDPETYKINQGIDLAQASSFVQKLLTNPKLADKIVRLYSTEEFSFLKHCLRERKALPHSGIARTCLQRPRTAAEKTAI